jgi:hypothetical protein
MSFTKIAKQILPFLSKVSVCKSSHLFTYSNAFRECYWLSDMKYLNFNENSAECKEGNCLHDIKCLV